MKGSKAESKGRDKRAGKGKRQLGYEVKTDKKE